MNIFRESRCTFIKIQICNLSFESRVA